MNILDLSKQAVLVTGAGQGVGRQAAIHLALHGARGIVVNDYVAERAEAVAAEINDQLGAQRAIGVQADVTDFASVRSMHEQASERFGTIDVLVNNAGNAGANAGALSRSPFWEQDPDEWSAWTAVNLTGVLNCTRIFLPGMIAQKSGSLVNVISDAGRVGEAGVEVYSAAKAGAAGFTRAIARSIGRFDIRANCVAISATRTPATQAYTDNPEFAKKALSQYVLRRFGEPGDIANMIVFLASGASSWITGQTYPVNGGFSMAV